MYNGLKPHKKLHCNPKILPFDHIFFNDFKVRKLILIHNIAHEILFQRRLKFNFIKLFGPIMRRYIQAYILTNSCILFFIDLHCYLAVMTVK